VLGTGTLASKGSTEVSARFFVLMVQVNSTYLRAKGMIRSIMNYMIHYAIFGTKGITLMSVPATVHYISGPEKPERNNVRCVLR
jgi:hypothetical protein